MKQKTLISAISDTTSPLVHTYKVTIGTEIGQFTGVVECLPEDFPHESSNFGFTLAETKAMIAYGRSKRNNAQQRLAALQSFLGKMCNTRTFDADAYVYKKLVQECENLRTEIRHWRQEVDHLKFWYAEQIRQRDAFFRAREGKTV